MKTRKEKTLTLIAAFSLLLILLLGMGKLDVHAANGDDKGRLTIDLSNGNVWDENKDLTADQLEAFIGFWDIALDNNCMQMLFEEHFDDCTIISLDVNVDGIGDITRTYYNDQQKDDWEENEDRSVFGSYTVTLPQEAKDYWINQQGSYPFYSSVTFKFTEKPALVTVGNVNVCDSGPVTGEGISGTIVYKADTNTLTLVNATITASSSDGTDFVIFNKTDKELNIILKGKNTITYEGSADKTSAIIFTKSKLDISGGGELTAKAKNCDSCYGLHTSYFGTLTLNDVTISLEFNETALFNAVYSSGNDIFIQSSSLNVTSGNGGNKGYGICALGADLNIDKSNVTIDIGNKTDDINCIRNLQKTIKVTNDSAVTLKSGETNYYNYGIYQERGTTSVDETSIMEVLTGKGAFAAAIKGDTDGATLQISDACSGHVLVNMDSDPDSAAAWDKSTPVPGNYKYFFKPGSLNKAKLVLSKTSFTYNGKVQKPSVKTIDGRQLTLGTDYTVVIKNSKGKAVTSPKTAGTYTVTATLNGRYYGTTGGAKFEIKKAANPLKVEGKAVSIKYSNLKTKAQKFSVKKMITKSGQGTITYKLSSVKKSGKDFKTYFKINEKTGAVTVKKGLKKGKYTVKATVKAAGNTNYKASGLKTITFTVTVK